MGGRRIIDREDGRISKEFHFLGELVGRRLNRHAGAMETEREEALDMLHPLVVDNELGL